MTKERLIEISKECLINDNRPDWMLETIRRPEQSLYYSFLYSLANEMTPSVIVELGTNRGTGAIHFKEGCPTALVITIDKKMPKHIAITLTANDIKWFKGDSVNAAVRVNEYLNGRKIDILFIDALHTYEKATEELKTYLPMMNEGGVILFDDIHLDEGMQQFWDEVDGEKIDISHLHPSPGFGAMICK